MKRLAFIAIAAATMVASGQAIVITQWNFNASTTTPNVGAGTASLVGGATSPSFNSGVGSSDPIASGNLGWQTTTYPAQGTANKTAGVQFLVSTVGFEDVTVSFDVRHSNTSSRFLQFQYSTDGSTWNDLGAALDHNLGDTWFNNNSFDLSSISAADNNASFGLRVVTAFGPAGGYEASNPTGSYGTAGTLRYDMVTINGTQVVPEPATLAALGLGAMALIRRKRK